jgi:cobalt-zinc-cadmium efflux system membrane fusion protein
MAGELTVPDAYLQTAIIVDRQGAIRGRWRHSGHARVAAPQGEAVVVARHRARSRMTKRLGDSVRAGEVLALVDSLDAAGFSADRSVASARARRQGAPTIAS